MTLPTDQGPNFIITLQLSIDPVSLITATMIQYYCDINFRIFTVHPRTQDDVLSGH